ncbi:uncharacterized protein LOC142348763 [Convolutriloba macropyga]|uniref:uncharacterized protein LOC142348763 n=1 Tax=Convolutriloba macropyga TaxID=536237 RepID=UPI003F5209B7
MRTLLNCYDFVSLLILIAAAIPQTYSIPSVEYGACVGPGKNVTCELWYDWDRILSTGQSEKRLRSRSVRSASVSMFTRKRRSVIGTCCVRCCVQEGDICTLIEDPQMSSQTTAVFRCTTELTPPEWTPK